MSPRNASSGQACGEFCPATAFSSFTPGNGAALEFSCSSNHTEINTTRRWQETCADSPGGPEPWKLRPREARRTVWNGNRPRACAPGPELQVGGSGGSPGSSPLDSVGCSPGGDPAGGEVHTSPLQRRCVPRAVSVWFGKTPPAGISIQRVANRCRQKVRVGSLETDGVTHLAGGTTGPRKGFVGTTVFLTSFELLGHI